MTGFDILLIAITIFQAFFIPFFIERTLVGPKNFF